MADTCQGSQKTQKFVVRKVTDVNTCRGGNCNGEGVAYDKGVDGDDGIFPIAFATVELENFNR